MGMWMPAGTEPDWQEAAARAEGLLAEHLSSEQRLTLEHRGYFDVETNGRTYRIRRGLGQCSLVGHPLTTEYFNFCAYPPFVPVADAMLTTKLWLEANERKYLEIAVWNGPGGMLEFMCPKKAAYLDKYFS